MKSMIAVTLVIASLWLTACAKEPEKPKARAPLPLSMSVSTAAVRATEEGAKAYQGRQFDVAKGSFEQALKAAPDSGEAHYNLGLALFALGENDAARDHFVEAANLAPGNKVIWDSPALRQYGNPDARLKKKGAQDYTNQKPGLGVPPGGMTR